MARAKRPVDKSRFRKKVFLDLLTSPWTLIPSVVGLSTLLFAWATAPGTELLAFLGLSGVLAGIGALASRWFLGSDKLLRKAYDELQAEALNREEHALNELDRRLHGDEDPRTEESLAELRQLYGRMKESDTWATGLSPAAAYEVTNKVEKLFRGCIMSLERSIELWETAQKMITGEARASVLEARERLVEEVRKSVQQLGKTIDSVQTMALHQDQEQNLARIRQELDDSLAVARRVEERIQEFDAEVGRMAARSERR